MSSDSRRAVYSQIAGHRGLDLINTVEWRLAPDRWVDDLRDFDDVLRWATQTGAVDQADADAVRDLARRDPSTAQLEFDRVRALREALYATLFEQAPPTPLGAEYARSVRSSRLEHRGAGWSWEAPIDLALPRRVLAIDAVEVLANTDLAGLSQCQDAQCGWVFLDTSPRRNRRWCIAADCGNRNRARDFYRRSRSVASR